MSRVAELWPWATQAAQSEAVGRSTEVTWFWEWYVIENG